jgi:hypothetical protein
VSDPLFLDDGFTRTHHVAASPGLYPAVDAEFRPALSRERNAHAAALNAGDPDRVEKFENDLLARHVLSLNGEPPEKWKSKLARLHPGVKTHLVNAVLSYAPARARTPEEDVRNLSSASG